MKLSQNLIKMVSNKNVDDSYTLVEQRFVANESFGDLKIWNQTSLDEM